MAIPITSTKKTLEELGGITPPFLWDSICQANRIGNRVRQRGGRQKFARPVETPSGFKTIDAYAIKLTPEMVLPTKTHLASGGYVRYDPLVSIDEMIGAA